MVRRKVGKFYLLKPLHSEDKSALKVAPEEISLAWMNIESDVKIKTPLKSVTRILQDVNHSVYKIPNKKYYVSQFFTAPWLIWFYDEHYFTKCATRISQFLLLPIKCSFSLSSFPMIVLVLHEVINYDMKLQQGRQNYGCSLQLQRCLMQMQLHILCFHAKLWKCLLSPDGKLTS